MAFGVSGERGGLRWGYRSIATVLAWTLTKTGDGAHVVTGTVTNVDTFGISQRPLVFTAEHSQGCWRFPVVELQIADGTLTATLGPQER